MSKLTKSEYNRAVAKRLGSYTPEMWARVVVARKAGATVNQAVKAAKAELTIAPAPKARSLNAQAKRVKAGKVLRDAKGRIVARDLAEVLEVTR